MRRKLAAVAEGAGSRRSRVEPSQRGIGQCGREEEFPLVRRQVVGRSLQHVIASRFARDPEAYRVGIAVDAQLCRLGISDSGGAERQQRRGDKLFNSHVGANLADRPFHRNARFRSFCEVLCDSFEIPGRSTRFMLLQPNSRLACGVWFSGQPNKPNANAEAPNDEVYSNSKFGILECPTPGATFLLRSLGLSHTRWRSKSPFPLTPPSPLGEGEWSTASRSHPCQCLPNDHRLNTHQQPAVPSP